MNSNQSNQTRMPWLGCHSPQHLYTSHILQYRRSASILSSSHNNRSRITCVTFSGPDVTMCDAGGWRQQWRAWSSAAGMLKMRPAAAAAVNICLRKSTEHYNLRQAGTHLISLDRLSMQHLHIYHIVRFAPSNINCYETLASVVLLISRLEEASSCLEIKAYFLHLLDRLTYLTSNHS